MISPTFPTKVLNIRNFCMSAIPKMGVQLGVIKFHPLHSSPFVRVCFTPKHTFLTSWPLHFTLSHKPDVKVVTMDFKKFNKVTKKNPYALPFFDEVLNIVPRYEAYSFLDGYSCYHHIFITLKDISKIAFVTY
jgi:hypothetical protein